VRTTISTRRTEQQSAQGLTQRLTAEDALKMPLIVSLPRFELSRGLLVGPWEAGDLQKLSGDVVGLWKIEIW
jgi:hypothetical protein